MARHTPIATAPPIPTVAVPAQRVRPPAEPGWAFGSADTSFAAYYRTSQRGQARDLALVSSACTYRLLDRFFTDPVLPTTTGEWSVDTLSPVLALVRLAGAPVALLGVVEERHGERGRLPRRVDVAAGVWDDAPDADGLRKFVISGHAGGDLLVAELLAEGQVGGVLSFLVADHVDHVGLLAPVRPGDVPQAPGPETLLAHLRAHARGEVHAEFAALASVNQGYGNATLIGIGLLTTTLEVTPAGHRLAALPINDARQALAARMATTLGVALCRGTSSRKELVSELRRHWATLHGRGGWPVDLAESTATRRSSQLVTWSTWCAEHLAETVHDVSVRVRTAPTTGFVHVPRDPQLDNTEFHAQVLPVVQAQLAKMDDRGFEWFIGHLLAHSGGRDVEVTRRGNDGGIDATCQLPFLGAGEVRAVVQAKRFQAGGSVSIRDVQRLRGTLSAGDIGVFYTTAGYSRAARDDAARTDGGRVLLVDGREVAALALAHGVGAHTRPDGSVEISDFTEFA